MNTNIEVLYEIICKIERMIGPVAWDFANEIEGITVDVTKKKIISVNDIYYNDAILCLVERYKKLLGSSASFQINDIISITLLLAGDNHDLRHIVRSPEIITIGHDLLAAQTELERVDMVIIEATQSFEHIYTLLGKAAIMQKPVLCVYKKDESPHELLSLLDKSSKSQYVFAQAYTEKTLPDIVQRFVSKINGKIVETPNIKFTLRLTPSLDRYLERVAQEKNVSKADFVRNMISEKQNKDSDYL